jgi:hypothetical protein
MKKPEEGCTHDEYGLLAVYSNRKTGQGVTPGMKKPCTPMNTELLLLQQRELISLSCLEPRASAPRRQASAGSSSRASARALLPLAAGAAQLPAALSCSG